jgi:hypothetical protein
MRWSRLRELNIPALCFALSAIGLGYALQISNGFYDPRALAWLTGALVFCLIGVLGHRFSSGLSAVSATAVGAVMIAGIAWQLQQLFAARPGIYIHEDAHLAVFRGAVVAQALLVALGALQINAARRWWFPAMLAVSLFIGAWMIRASPDPYIDVVEVHKEAINAVIHHRDPYRISFANIYENVDARKFYNPEALIGGRLAFAYPYPPPSLLLAVPGQVLLGDYRYSELGLLVAAAALIGFARRGMAAQLAATLLLTTPRIWFVIEEGWTEPIGVFLLALTVFLLIRNPIAAGWAGGVLAVTKQYLGFTGLAVLRIAFMRPGQWKWTAFGIAFAAAAVTLPFALWHPNAFMRNVVWLQTLEPFRNDSLSYLAWAVRRGMSAGSFVWAIGAGIVAAILTLFTTRNTPEGFAASVALTTFAFFAFGSKAFCNYYFLVIGALCCAIAAFELNSPNAAITE